MNDAPAKVLPILATPFGVVTLADALELHPALLELFAARMKSEARARRQPFCYQSDEDLLTLKDEPVPRLTPILTRGMTSVISAVNDFSDEQLRSFVMQSRSSFTVVSPDGCVPAMSHPLTAWCGVYCVTAPEPSPSRADSGVLRLYETRLGTMFQDATNAAMHLPFTTGHYAWRPVPGQLAVFPGSLTHEVALLKGAGQLSFITLRVRFVAPGQQGLTRW